MNYYNGRLGKDGDFVLASEAPIILWKQGMSEFIGLNSLEEAKRHLESEEDTRIFIWDDGIWKKIDFAVLTNRPTRVIGFNPN